MDSMRIAGTSSSSSTPRWTYDVFLSFRGEDTRNNFVSHLYTGLQQKGIYTYKDDEKLERGKEISPELLKAIESSRFSIIVFSKNYASSTWCLDELVKIHECKKVMGQRVLPIFHNVNPTEVQKQGGCFGKAFAKHENLKGKIEKVQRWRTTLMEIANLSGWDTQDRSESIVIKEIINAILNELISTSPSDAENLFGIKSRVDHMNSLLCTGQNGIHFVGIYGMGGIGKTTIAKVVYDQISDEFEGSCFLSNVREGSKEHGLVHLQEKLLSRILMEENVDIDTPSTGTHAIKERLCSKTVLIVLDDVDTLEQLEALAGRHNWFGSGSRVIITTRDEQLLIAHGVAKRYKAKELDPDAAIQLFCSKAFREKYPREQYAELTKAVIQYAQGLPLALKILGSFLRGRSILGWESVLKKLKESPNGEIHEILQISYEGLDNTEKDLFLDIACFFKGDDKEYITNLLDSCNLYPGIGLSVLAQKSLITILDNNVLMHDLLQEMGREIVRQESHEDPGKRSRLWSQEDVSRILMNKSGSDVIEGIVLELSGLEELNFSAKAFAVMKKLKLLKVCDVHCPEGFKYFTRKELIFRRDFVGINELEIHRDCKVQLSGAFEFLSSELRCFYWYAFPLKSLPPEFHPENLVELNLCHSRIERLWDHSKLLGKLKFLKLSHSQHLTKTPSFEGAPNLERLILQGCKRLVEVHPSIGVLNKLILLDLRDCKNLGSLPSSICMLQSLERLYLSGCSKLDRLPQKLGNIKSLVELCADRTAIRQAPLSIALLKNLEVFFIGGFKQTVRESWSSHFLSMFFPSKCQNSISLLLPPLSGFSSLTKLDLSDSNLLEIPNDIGCLWSLCELNLSGNNFAIIPSSISQLFKLWKLYLEGCARLRELPQLPSHIDLLVADGCTSLERLSNPFTLKSWHIRFSNCLKLVENQDNDNLADILLQSQLQTPNTWFDSEIVLPGSNIPKWFSHQNIGDSVSIQLVGNSCDIIIGVAICAIFKSGDSTCPSIASCFYGWNDSFDEFECSIYCSPQPDFRSNKEHVWIGHQKFTEFGELFENSKNVDLFKFEVNFKDSSDSDFVLEKCGFRLLYEEDLEENNKDIIQYISPSENLNAVEIQEEDLALKRNYEAMNASGSGCSDEDPLPKRLRGQLDSTAKLKGKSCQTQIWDFMKDSSSYSSPQYHVFLSFRGEDTGNNFTDHLHAALHQKGIKTFIDNKQRRGEEISSAFLQAIEDSSFSIVVFSENYASSSWCLDELVKILDCKKAMNQVVLPIFHNVDPSEVRKQTGSYAKAFAKHEEVFRDKMEKVQMWRVALAEAASISGWDSRDRSESVFIEKIVKFISNRLIRTSSSDIEGLVGIDSRLKEMHSLLCVGLDDVRFVGICGTGGIGKTTIAEAVYNQIRDKFEGCCFLKNVKEASKKYGLIHLQQQLLSKILMEGNLHIDNLSMGIKLIKTRLCCRKVLIVLDGVDNLEQLDSLSGSQDWFGFGSRIIVTTRDKQLLAVHEVEKIYKTRKLDEDEAVQLFCKKAFGKICPPEDYADLSNAVVNYAMGLPLALKVLGSFLCGRSIGEWESALKKLKGNPTNKIQEILNVNSDKLENME
ncbi:TMV resistance protein N-like [Malania oleifera]|uniref:TMV resistance protein N-like n=1 Tax=Malania oleifera TaxID=397392 RepID=UPI0025AE3325|nr:TMV resistance protein N-like [Malania oleifera]